MAVIGLSIPSITIAPLLNGHVGLVGLTFKPVSISVRNAVMLEVNQVIFNSNVNINPVSFEAVNPIGGIIYRQDNNEGTPYLKETTGGDAIANDSFQFISLTSNNFAFFTKDALFTLCQISSNLIFSGAEYTPGMVAYSGSGIAGAYGTLKVEVDRGNLKIINDDNTDNQKIPAAIVGTPCPPSWDPFN